MKPGFLVAGVLCAVLLSAMPLRAGQASSAEARRLADLMVAGHLDAIAARDSTNPDRFVAALLYPNSELLVISARYATPAALQPLLDQRNYHEVYGDLQTSPDASEQVFFIDAKADGLSNGQGDGIDVLYEPGNKQTVFDEAWRKQHGLGEREFEQKYQSAEKEYGAMLATLVSALQTQSASR